MRRWDDYALDDGHDDILFRWLELPITLLGVVGVVYFAIRFAAASWFK